MNAEEGKLRVGGITGLDYTGLYELFDSYRRFDFMSNIGNSKGLCR